MEKIEFNCCKGFDKFIEKLENVFPYECKFKKFMENKFGDFLAEKVKTFIIEYPYIEKEWRDLYSLHYCKTNYKETKPFAYRIHLLDDEVDNVKDITVNSKTHISESYMGYITLRPLPVSVISKIVIDPKKYFYSLEDAEELFMITAEYVVNIKDKKIKFQAFPLFCQDSVVTVCIHATGLMLSDLMHRRYKNNKISIEKVVLDESPHLGRKIPSRGITVNHLSKILIKNGYYVKIKNISLKNRPENTTIKRYVECFIGVIDAYIESGLPCMLIFDEHLITIAGHTFDRNKGIVDYIVFDESGSHIKKHFEKGKPLFSTSIRKEYLVNKIKSLIEKETIVSLLYPEFERIYFPVEKVEELTEETIRKYLRDINDNNDSIDKNPNNYVKRILLVDCKKLVRFLLKNNINDFENVCFPHYLWYIESYYKIRGKKENLGVCMIVDASAHRDDRLYSIFKNENGERIFNPQGNILSLLK